MSLSFKGQASSSSASYFDTLQVFSAISYSGAALDLRSGVCRASVQGRVGTSLFTTVIRKMANGELTPTSFFTFLRFFLIAKLP